MKYSRDQLRVLQKATGKEQIVCNKCMTADEWDAISDPKTIMQAGDMDKNDAYFCDRCGKRIHATDK